MQTLLQVFDLIMHLDVHLAALSHEYGAWTYAILFLIIFAETGLVVTPFLPGDSLLFICGTIAAGGGLDASMLAVVLSIAAIAGNAVNYWIGRYLGPRVFHWPDSRLFSRAALLRTHAFYERHGGKTIVICRFLPIIRTFAPFVAGIGAMQHWRFQLFNVVGAALWVSSLIAAGYFFGNLPVVRNNLSLMIVAIVVVSTLPALVGYWQHRAAARDRPRRNPAD